METFVPKGRDTRGAERLRPMDRADVGSPEMPGWGRDLALLGYRKAESLRGR